MNTALPLASTIVSLMFALTVLDQFFAKKRPYQLVWAMGLFMFFVSSGCEFWTEACGIDRTVYQLWYLFGAILVAAYLGMGTLYLLLPRRAAHIVMAVLLVASLYAIFRVFTANLDPRAIHYLSGRFMPQGVLSNILIAVGALMPALGGILMRFGMRSVTPVYALELLGIVIVFVGFLRSREVFGFYRFPLVRGFRIGA